jgi:hypothetical protein
MADTAQDPVVNTDPVVENTDPVIAVTTPQPAAPDQQSGWAVPRDAAPLNASYQPVTQRASPAAPPLDTNIVSLQAKGLANDIAGIPAEFARDPANLIFGGLPKLGKIAAGAATDLLAGNVTPTPGRLAPTFPNTSAALAGQTPPDQANLPTVGKVIAGAVEQAPTVAAGAGLTAVGVPAPVAFAALMGGQTYAETHDPLKSATSAALGAVIPAASHLGGEMGADALGNLVAKSGASDAMIAAAKTIGRMGGSQALLNGVTVAAQSPELIALAKTDPDAAKDQLVQIVGQNLAFEIPGIPKLLADNHAQALVDAFQGVARKVFTEKLTTEYSPADLRDIYNRVSRDASFPDQPPTASPEEHDIVNFIASTAAPGQTIRAGVNAEQTVPTISSPFWIKHLGLDATDPQYSVNGTPSKPASPQPAPSANRSLRLAAPAASNPDPIIPEESNAPNPIAQPAGVPQERVGTSPQQPIEAAEATPVASPSPGDSLPGATRQPLAPPQPPVAAPRPADVAAPRGTNVGQSDEAARQQARAETDTDPTPAQKEAGNYAKGRIQLHGLTIAIENPAGSLRTGTDANGKSWQVKMPADYGQILGQPAADDDLLDAYIGPNLQSQKVFIVDQRDPKTGAFDEHKVMLGFDSGEQAIRTYNAGFSDNSGASRLHALTETSVPQFKDWLKNGDKSKPTADYAEQQQKASRRSLRNKAAADRPHDIIDEFESQVGGKISLRKARAIIEDFEPVGAARGLFSAHGVAPDVAAQAMGKNLSDEDFLEASNTAARARINGRSTKSTEDAAIDKMAEQKTAFDHFSKKTGPNKEALPTHNLFPGETFSIEGQKFTVGHIDADDDGHPTAIHVSDGNKFGDQTLDPTHTIHIDKGSHVQKKQFDFLPEEHVEEKPAPVAKQRSIRETPAEPAKPVSERQPVQSPSQTIADFVKHEIKAGFQFTSKDLFSVADKAFGGTQAEGKYSVKDAYDAMELAVNQYISENPKGVSTAADDLAAKMIVLQLKEMVSRLPTQTKRTAEMDEFQQFSTPPPLAYVAAWAANPHPGETVLEPSAGVGGIAIFAKNAGARVIVNELSDRRRALLKHLPFDQVTGENAEQIHNILPAAIQPDIVLMNPPFSSTAGRMQGKRSTSNATLHIEQALLRLNPGGRLVAIVGEGMASDRPAFAAWWKKIKSQYNVRANIGVSGEEYKKYGTSFGNQILVIDKSGPTTQAPVTGELTKIEDLIPLLDRLHEERAQAQPASGTGSDVSRQPEDRIEPNPGTRGAARVETGSRPEPQPPAQPAGEPLPQENASQRSLRPRANEPGIAKPGRSIRGRNAGPSPVGAAPRPAASQSDVVSPQPHPVPETDRGGNAAGGRTPSDGAPGASTASDVGRAEDVSQRSDATLGTVEAGENIIHRGAMKDAVYEDYRPQIKVAGSRPHPTPISESAAMSAERYPTPSYRPNLPEVTITSGVSDAQLENVILAGQAHSKTLPSGERQGYFIGDGTGVGKGRTNAGIIFDNWNQGRKKAVWFSANDALYDDANRDMVGIGWNATQSLRHSKFKKPDEPITAPRGVLFSTYSMMRSPRRVKQISDWLGKDFDGVIIFDEAHLMGNAVQTEGKRGTKKASQQGLAGVEFQKAFPNARIVYVSATGATEVSNLAYAERLGLWGEGTPFPNKIDFINRIGAGGVAAMELVAKDLKATGRYLARNLSFGESAPGKGDGVTYRTIQQKFTPEQTAMYDRLAEAWQSVLRNIDAALETAAGGKKNSRARANAIGQFWGSHQRFFNQVLTSMEMPAVLADMKDVLAKGHSVIAQLVNTGEAATERAIGRKEDEEVQDLEDLDVTPREILMQYIENSFPVQQWEEYSDEEGNVQFRPVLDSEGNPVQNAEAVAMREQLLNDLASIRVPSSALDLLIEEFGHENVAEITGRSRRVVSKDTPEGRKKVIEKRGPQANAADLADYKNDKKKILAFSYAGGTGATYSADLTFKNQRLRVHYVVQPGWRADGAIQGLGRSNRSNQKQAPQFVTCSTDLPGHKRFVSTIARRIEQLGALTKGQRQTASGGVFDARDNLESSYAKEALKSFLHHVANGDIKGVSAAEFQNQTGLRLREEKGGYIGDKIEIGQFLNRLLSLKIDLQHKVFDAFSESLDATIDWHKSNGTLDAGLETLRALHTRQVNETTLYTHPSTGAVTKHVELKLTHPTKVLAWQKSFGDEKFVVNKRSGQIWKLSPLRTYATADGKEENFYTATSPGYSSQKFPAHSITDERFDKLDGVEAREKWDTAVAALPKTYDQTAHLITGTVLPVWDRLGTAAHRIARAQTDEGIRHIGILLSHQELGPVLKNFGVGAPKISSSEAIAAVLDHNQRLKLSNGWTISRRLVAGDDRIEISGPELADQPILKRQGVMMERIAFQMRYFIPTGSQAADVLSRVLQGRDIVEAQGGHASLTPENQTPITIPGNKFKAGTAGASRKLALEWAKQNLKGEFLNKPTGWNIKVGNHAIKKALSGIRNAHDDHVEAIAGLPQLLQESTLEATRPDRDNNPDIKAIHILRAPIQIGDRVHSVKLTVKETKDGKFFYDHSLTKIERPAGISADHASVSKGSGSGSPQTGPAKNMVLSRSDVNNAVQRVVANWPNAPKIEIVDRPDWRVTDRSGQPQTVVGHSTSRGIVINIAGVRSPEHLTQVLAEEIVGHYGAEQALGPQFQTEIDAIGKGVSDDDLAPIAEQYNLDLSNPSDRREAVIEFVAKQARAERPPETGNAKPSLFRRLWDAIVNALKRLFGNGKPSAERVNNILERAHDFLEGKTDRQPTSTHEGRFSLAKDEGVPHQVLGKSTTVGGRERLDENAATASLQHAGDAFRSAGIPVTLVKESDPRRVNYESQWWRIDDNGFDLHAEGRKLVDIVKKSLATENQPGKPLGHVSDLVNSLTINFQRGLMNQFDPSSRAELFALVRGYASRVGAELGALARNSVDLQDVGHNPDLFLQRTYSDAFGGEQYETIVKRAAEQFRSFFSEGEIRDAFKTAEDAEKFINQLLALSQRQQSGRVYRAVQRMLKPTRPVTLNQMESKAKVNEAVESIIAHAKKLGIEEPPSRGKTKLTPDERLGLMARPETEEKLQEAIDAAVHEAEVNAGNAAWRKSVAGSTEAREDVDARIAAGEEPAPEFVEQGLSLLEFAHWRPIRDNLLSYSPTTLKLVRNVIEGRFKGARFTPRQVGPPDFRIDLAELAKNPDAEVQRVTDAQLAEVERVLDLNRASDATKARVLQAVRGQIAQQIERIRANTRDTALAAARKPAAARTPEERIAELINAKLFADPRLDVPEMVERLAAKGAIKNLIPTAAKLAKEILRAPASSQADLRLAFIERLVQGLGLSPQDAAQAWKVFASAFDSRLKTARAKASDSALKSLSPAEKQAVNKRSLADVVRRNVNAGNFDTAQILRDVARKNGWTIPTDDDIAKLKELTNREQALRELSPAQRDAIFNNPDLTDAEKQQEIAAKLTEKEAATVYARAKLLHEISLRWARMSKPTGWRGFAGLGRGDLLPGQSSPAENRARMMNEYGVMNVLDKTGYWIARLPTHMLAVQSTIHLASNTLARFFTERSAAKDAGNPLAFDAGLHAALRDSFNSIVASIKPAVLAARAEMMGRGLGRNVGELNEGLNTFERLKAKADALAQAGKPVQAAALYFSSLPGLVRFYIAALDQLQGTPAEYQEIVNEVAIALREQGRSSAEIQTVTDSILKSCKSDFLRATNDAAEILRASGEAPTDAQIKEAAVQLLRARTYAQIKAMGLPADDFQARIEELRKTLAWQQPVQHGIGGYVATVPKLARNVLAKAGIPFPFANLSNAMGTAINYGLMFAPSIPGTKYGLNRLAFFPVNAGAPPVSPWEATARQRQQAAIMSLLGTIAGGAIIALLLSGRAKAQLGYPKKKEDRDRFIAEGHRPGTIEFYNADGTYSAYSLNVGPFNPLRGYIYAGAAINDLNASHAAAQKKADATAAKHGVPPQQIPGPSAAAVSRAALVAFFQGIVEGSSVVSGAVQSVSEKGDASLKKTVASGISAYIPELPKLQELTRAAGVSLDPKRATVLDYMVPLPSSGAREVNMLGDPVKTPDDVQRIVQTFTSGTYPLSIDPKADADARAYQAVEETGFRPPSINPGKGYSIGGEFRPLTSDELENYTVARGQLLKQSLSETPITSKSQVQALFAAADQQALAQVGVQQPVQSQVGQSSNPFTESANPPIAATPAGRQQAASPQPASGGGANASAGFQRGFAASGGPGSNSGNSSGGSGSGSLGRSLRGGGRSSLRSGHHSASTRGSHAASLKGPRQSHSGSLRIRSAGGSHHAARSIRIR